MAADDSPPTPPNTRPARGALRARFEEMQDKVLDEAMGVGDTWAKNVRNGNRGVMLNDIPRLLEVLGLKMVDAARICITPAQLDYYEACKTIAAQHLAPAAPKLDWGTPT